jgi:hypothetical protein
MADKRRGYNIPKALCIRGELTRFRMIRILSDNNPTMDQSIHDRIDVSIGNQSEGEGMQRHRLRNIRIIRCLNTKRF